MKIQIIRSLLAVALAAVPGAIQAQPDAHYVPGIEGIKCATLPPPGFYFRDYNVFYVADQLNNGAGDSVGPNNFQALVYANVPRAIWITDTQFLGGNVGVDVVLPLVYTQPEGGSVQQQHVWRRRRLRREHPFVASETIRHRRGPRPLGADGRFGQTDLTRSERAFGRRCSPRE